VQTKILVIDDDDSIRDTVGVMLERENFTPFLAADGKSGFEKALAVKPQLIIVDLRLPAMSGMDVCRQLRAEQIKTPIIVLSAVAEEIDKVLLLESGADDYVVKPFGTRELLARIRAILRRSGPDSETSIRFSDVEVDVERRVVRRNKKEVKLTPGEYNLLLFFLQNADRALSRDLLLNSVWGFESYPNTRTVDAHVVHLRQKLEPDPATPRYFITVHGIGYRFLF
jgi:DNA-binding response OmpR family regulator